MGSVPVRTGQSVVDSTRIAPRTPGTIPRWSVSRVGQAAELVGLDFTPPPTLFGVAYHASVSVSAGTVAFRDCKLIAGRSYCGAGRPALTVTDAHVALQDCRLYGVDYRSPGSRPRAPR